MQSIIGRPNSQTSDDTPIAKMLRAFPSSKGPNSAGWYHHPDDPDFSFIENENGSIRINPHSGRTREEIIAMGGLSVEDLYPTGTRRSSHVQPKIDLLALAEDRHIPWQFLFNLGLSDGYKYHGQSAVKIPYHLPDGSEHTKIKVRLIVKETPGKKEQKHAWDEGTPGEMIPYGLERLHMAKDAGYLIIGEGESDGWVCWFNDIPYLGVPGATNDKVLTPYAELLLDIPCIYIILEPDQAKKMQSTGTSFYKSVHQRLREIGYDGDIFCIDFKKHGSAKDPGELWSELWDENIGDIPIQQRKGFFTKFMQEARDKAIPSGDAKKLETIAEAIEQQDMQAILSMVAQIAALDEYDRLKLYTTIKSTFGHAFPMAEFKEQVRAEAHRLEQAQQRDFEVKSLQSLMAKRFDPVEWVIPGILPVGLDLLAGRQKIGKSWLTLALAITVATGGYMFGNIKVDEGDVLHLAMEDNERRLHSRYAHGLQEMAPGSGIPKRIDVMEGWPRLDAGGLGKLEEWIKSKPNPRLIIIDPWVKIKPYVKQRAGATGYDADYEAFEGLKQLADKYSICILVLMHLRKAKSEDDPMDEINSSTGASATADGTLILKRQRGEAVGTLWGTGRDYEEDVNLAVTFDNGIWKIVSDARRQVKLTPGSKEIIDILIEANRPMMPQELAAYLQIGTGAMRKRLSDMKGKGEISDTGKGYISNISLEENRYVLKNINGGNGGNGGNAQQYQDSFTSPREVTLSNTVNMCPQRSL